MEQDEIIFELNISGNNHISKLKNENSKDKKKEPKGFLLI